MTGNKDILPNCLLYKLTNGILHNRKIYGGKLLAVPTASLLWNAFARQHSKQYEYVKNFKSKLKTFLLHELSMDIATYFLIFIHWFFC